ncbi:MAG: 5'/3'-nucleotidase SurE [Acidimicrobiales bacterium]
MAIGVALVLGACGGDDDGPIPQTGERQTTTTAEGTTTTTEAAGEGAAGQGAAGDDTLEVLVTNDDGFAAAGIDTLVEALRQADGVTVTVVAPATEQSGTGGNATEGVLATAEGETASGFGVTSVEGFPSDAIRVALDDMGLQPDLVISGINLGQNLGPVVDVSGTVGAARAAVRAGVPALAASAGLADPPDYATAAGLVLDWLEQNRAAIVAGELPTDTVPNLNVPTCEAGEVRGLVEVASATAGNPLAAANCQSTGEGYSDDVTAFNNGFATLSEVPVEPAAPAA